MKKIPELTKAEEEIMQILWEIEQGFVNDIIERLVPPKPAYTTVSTIVRILEKKGVVGYKSFGKSHQYFPKVSKEEYSAFKSKNLLKKYFDGSVSRMLSFFLEKENVTLKELEEIKKIIEQNRKK
jgi:BlaI family transcriptional regulator, penicillinase repressor